MTATGETATGVTATGVTRDVTGVTSDRPPGPPRSKRSASSPGSLHGFTGNAGEGRREAWYEPFAHARIIRGSDTVYVCYTCTCYHSTTNAAPIQYALKVALQRYNDIPRSYFKKGSLFSRQCF